jgi:plastocyanin
MVAIRCAAVALLVALSGCTFGAPTASSGAGAVNAQTISVDLTQFMLGYSPDILTVNVSTTVQFINNDSFAHTATSIAGSTFPDASPFTAAALTPSQSGADISGTWTSGILEAGAASPTFVADLPGTYLFGCFFHYGHPMRGEIIVR